MHPPELYFLQISRENWYSWTVEVTMSPSIAFFVANRCWMVAIEMVPWPVVVSEWWLELRLYIIINYYFIGLFKINLSKFTILPFDFFLVVKNMLVLMI